jgi:membrane protease YdiL (CAAX protease family)
MKQRWANRVAVWPFAVQWDLIALVAYLALLTIGELAVSFGNPLLVFPLHGGIVGLAALHVAVLEGRSEREAGRHPLTPFLLAFIVVALIRIISYTLPLAAIEPAYRYLAAGVPMALGALLVARAAGYSMRDVGLAWRMWRLQAIVIVASMGLGFIEFAILRPAPIGPFPWAAAGVIPAVVVGIATGLPEELVFRGVLQTATRPILGRLNWIYVSLVFAVLHIGYQSAPDLAFVFGVGLLYGWVFERSRSIVGVSIGHGLANVILFFVAPNLPVIARWVGI